MTERRRILRKRTLKGGTIIYGTVADIDCVIRNLSDIGASPTTSRS